tara:strand:+ start:4817 stop:5485 length:669 start_codon:yes stop_codon:yes gene_type:complete
MPKSVHFSGTNDGLRQAIEDRLVRAGASISEEPQGADMNIGLGTDLECDIAVLPPGSDSDRADLVVRLCDVIIPNGGRDWGTGTLLDWVDQVKHGLEPQTGSDSRYWVNVRDVADALVTLALGRDGLAYSGRVNMCGRRGWRDEDVVDEIRILWERYNNAINHSHTVDSLSGVPSPVRGIHSQHESPELGALHNALIESGGEGWHPLVPMRTSLMELIASTE